MNTVNDSSKRELYTPSSPNVQNHSISQHIPLSPHDSSLADMCISGISKDHIKDHNPCQPKGQNENHHNYEDRGRLRVKTRIASLGNPEMISLMGFTTSTTKPKREKRGSG